MTDETLITRLQVAIAVIDKADADCPVRHAKKLLKECPKCGATTSQNCGPSVCAVYDLEQTVRELITPSEAERAKETVG